MCFTKHKIFSLLLLIQGIYRVNGAKSRVEKLCQAFENGKELVELSDLSPHDISNVLKLYLRQVGHENLSDSHTAFCLCSSQICLNAIATVPRPLSL